MRALIRVTILVIALAVPASAEAGHQGTMDDLQRGLERVVGAQAGPPGASALVDRFGHPTFLTSGVSSVKGKRPFRRTDHMRLASTSKAYNGAVALSLVDTGDLDLDDTIGSVLPSLPPAWSSVTLREMLDHTSGLPSYTDNDAFRAYFEDHLHDHVTPEQILAFIEDEDTVFTPGTSYAYSNTDNLVIALMAEAATGRSYQSLLRQRVFNPLGLAETALPGGFRLASPLIHGYEVKPSAAAPEDVTECCSMSFVWASGGMSSTPVELARFTRAYVGGELFGPATRAQQFDFVPRGSSEPPGPGHNDAGLAMFRYRTPCGTVFGHTGNFPGYTQFTAASRSGRRSVTVSANEQLSPDVHAAVFEHLHRAFRLGVCAALAGRS